jgi:hypothetical protein
MRENDDGAAFDRVGSNGGAPGAASDLCDRMRVRPRRAPHPPCFRTLRNLLTVPPLMPQRTAAWRWL